MVCTRDYDGHMTNIRSHQLTDPRIIKCHDHRHRSTKSDSEYDYLYRQTLHDFTAKNCNISLKEKIENLMSDPGCVICILELLIMTELTGYLLQINPHSPMHVCDTPNIFGQMEVPVHTFCSTIDDEGVIIWKYKWGKSLSLLVQKDGPIILHHYCDKKTKTIVCNTIEEAVNTINVLAK
jgi:hypothetical protein